METEFVVIPGNRLGRKTFAASILSAFRDRRVEPHPRMVGGVFGWAVHRFPIKGGISLHEAMNRNMARQSSLLRMLHGQ